MRTITYQGQKLSAVALGCDHFGETIPQETAFSNLDHYLEAGGSLLDIAHRYGQDVDEGPSRSERCIGSWMKRRGSRGDVFLATKGCCGAHDDLHQRRLNAHAVKADIQGSLDDLMVDRVDLWYFHRDDPSIPADELIDMANELVLGKGYCRFLGASNWTGERIGQANSWAKTHGRVPFTFSEIQASLARCTPEGWGDDTLVCMNEEEEDWYRKHPMAVMAFSSQAKGLFSKLIEGGELSPKARKRFYTDENKKIVPVVKDIALRHQSPVSAVVLAWLMQRPGMTIIPIVSASKTSQLDNTLSGLDLQLDEEEIQELDEARKR